MKISIVTAVYNRASTLGDAIASVQNQEFPNIEHVIQDGGSSDGSLGVVAQFSDPRIKVQSAPDGGIYDAINKGITRATGEVIGLLHSDDFLAAEDVVGKIARAFAKPDVQGVYGDLQYVSASDPRRVVRHWSAGDYSPHLLKRGWMPPHPTLYLRREIFEKFGLYDTSFRIAADYDAMLRYLAHGRIKLAYIPEVLVKMRMGGESNKSVERILRKSREDLRALRKNEVGGLLTLAAKNITKVGQFLVKDEVSK
uniref:glycosyltransferase family 2 protein n=1 Tax=uncultured Altererythrobacter sp. TaxID=500840 RepID=UPI002616FBD2|nr:glycosyltransferase family 2 protein [uncultured Altererythrobacter sp.]